MVQPTLIRVPIQSNPIRSSPAQSCPVLSRPVKVQSGPVKVHHRHTVQSQGQDYLEQILPLCCCCFLLLLLAARRSPALPDLGPGALYLIRLCSCLLHPPFLLHRSTASVSGHSICRLPSSLFLIIYTPAAQPCPVTHHPLHLPPLSTNLSQVFAGCSCFCSSPASITPACSPPPSWPRFINIRHPADSACQTRPASLARHFTTLSAAILELTACYCVAPGLVL